MGDEKYESALGDAEYGPAVLFVVPQPPDMDALEPDVRELVRQAVAAVEAEPNQDGPIGRLGMIYQANLMTELAVPCYRRASESGDWSGKWHHLLGIAAVETGNNAVAEEAFRAAQSVDAANAATKFHLGMLYFDLGRLDEAEKLFEQVVSLVPDAPGGYFGLGRIAARRDQLERAQELLSQAQARSRDGKRILHQLGLVQRRLARDRNDPALTDSARANLIAARSAQNVALVPDAWMAELVGMTRVAASLANRANRLIQQGELESASQLLKRIIDRYPEQEEFLLQLARVRVLEKNMNEARSLCETASRIASENYRTWLMLGEADLAAGEPDTAGRAAERAFQLAPNEISVLFLKGRISLRAGDLAGSERLFREALAQDPQHAGATLGLADTLVRMNRVGEALPFARQAVELDPRSGYARFELGVALASIGDLAGSERQMRAALELNPDSRAAREYLTWLLAQKPEPTQSEAPPAEGEAGTLTESTSG